MWIRHLPPLLLLLGVLLLLNPLYAFQVGTSPNYYYEVDTVDPSDDGAVVEAVLRSDRGLTCPGPRECTLEREIHEVGGLEVSDDVVSQHRTYERGYDVVWVGGGYVEPVEERDGDVVRLAHRPIDREEAFSLAVLDTERTTVSADAIAAVERGSVWTDRRVPELASRATIAHEGEYYRTTGSRYSADGIDRPWIWPVRAVGFLLGLACVAFGYRESMLGS